MSSLRAGLPRFVVVGACALAGAVIGLLISAAIAMGSVHVLPTTSSPIGVTSAWDRAINPATSKEMWRLTYRDGNGDVYGVPIFYPDELAPFPLPPPPGPELWVPLGLVIGLFVGGVGVYAVRPGGDGGYATETVAT